MSTQSNAMRCGHIHRTTEAWHREQHEHQINRQCDVWLQVSAESRLHHSIEKQLNTSMYTLSNPVPTFEHHTACGPGHPELSKSYMDMASKLFTFTFTFTCCKLVIFTGFLTAISLCWCISNPAHPNVNTLLHEFAEILLAPYFLAILCRFVGNWWEGRKKGRSWKVFSITYMTRSFLLQPWMCISHIIPGNLQGTTAVCSTLVSR